jgi:hypothetical protein
MAPTLASSAKVTSGAANVGATLVSGNIVVAVGDVLIVKAGTSSAVTATNGATPSTVQDSLVNTWGAAKVLGTNSGSNGGTGLWAATVTVAGTTTITVNFTRSGTSSNANFEWEQWTGAQLAGTPATNATNYSGVTGAPSGAITTVAAGSVVSWMDNDFAAIAPGTPTYRTGSGTVTQETIEDQSGIGQYVTYHAWQTTTSTGSQTYGLSAPTGQSWQLLAIEIQASSGGGATPTAVRAQPGQTWKRQFKHRQLRLPDPPVAVPTAPDFVPTAMTRRRWNRRMLPLLPSGSAVSPTGSQAQPPHPRTVRVVRRRFPYAAYGPDSFSPPSGQVRVPSQNRRRLLRPRLPVDGDSYSPPPNQTTPVVNPPISQTVTAALRRWGLRRDGTSVTPVPVQVAAPTNPSITQVTSGRVRRIGVLLRRPGAATPTVQQGVVLPVQPRRAGFRFRRRPQAVAPVPVQVAAPVNPTTTQYGSLWVKRWGLRRYGRVSNPTPGQQTAPTNPPITQLGSLWAKRWGLRRYGRVANPTPAQQTAPTNPAITALTAVRARVGARALRRGKVSNPTPAQQAAVTAPPLTQLTAVRGRAVVHGAPRRPQAAAPPIPQATPPTVTTERRGLLRVRRARPRVAVQPPPQAAPPIQMEHRPPRLRRMLRRLGFPIQGGTAPTSTAVSTIGSLGATATDLGSVTGPDGTGAGGGSVGLGGVAGADETGQTGGSGMTGSAQ